MAFEVMQQFIQDFADGGGLRRVLFTWEKTKISRFFKLENFQKMLKNHEKFTICRKFSNLHTKISMEN